MPDLKWVVKDTDNDIYLTGYAGGGSLCQWGVVANAIRYSTLQEANDIIATLGAGNFIGTNPPPH